jgi:hypothetical protein
MCNLNKGFKLCSCTEELKDDQTDWILKRKDRKPPVLHRKGKAAVPLFSKEEKALKTEIINHLNKENCFDFPFEASEDDYLRLRISKTNNRWLAFRFSNGKWENDTSTSLSSWRSQLRVWGQGKVQV